MAMNLIVVGKGQCAVMALDTGKEIKGFCAHNLNNDNIALFVLGKGKSGKEDAYRQLLFNIDKYTDIVSIVTVIRDKVDVSKMFKRIILKKDTNSAISQTVSQALEKLLIDIELKFAPEDFYYSDQGTFRMFTDLKTQNVDVSDEDAASDLISCSIYDIDFERCRNCIHSLNTYFSAESTAFPVDVLFSGKSFTPIPQFENDTLVNDLDSLRDLSREEVREWLQSDETVRKYPNLVSRLDSLDQNDRQILRNEMIDTIFTYLSCVNACKTNVFHVYLGTTNSLEKIRCIAEMAISIGTKETIKWLRGTDNKPYIQVTLKSEAFQLEAHSKLFDDSQVIKQTE